MNEKSSENEKKEPFWKKMKFALIFIVTFYSIAIIMWLTTNTIFYLYNFVIIGTSIGLGAGLWPVLSKKKRHKARQLSQALVGGYMFFGLGIGLIYIFFGIIQPENMQFTGFWFYLFAGLFGAAVLHYTIAKILGPFQFNRGWCGWACWTAAVLDYLPWKKSPGRIKKLGIIRYIHFFISTTLITVLVFIVGYSLMDTHGWVLLSGEPIAPTHQYNSLWEIPEVWWFIIGNIFYYVSGIILAIVLKDNRAFCKYLCPIACFLKIGSKFSMLKIKGDKDKCTSCGACDRSCPMDIQVSEYIAQGFRVSSSECIMCMNCINVCPNNNLTTSFKIEKSHPEFIHFKEKKIIQDNK